MKRFAWMLLLYLTVCDNNFFDFQTKVNNALELGYKPSGSVAMALNPNDMNPNTRITWCQALTKESQ